MSLPLVAERREEGVVDGVRPDLDEVVLDQSGQLRGGDASTVGRQDRRLADDGVAKPAQDALSVLRGQVAQCGPELEERGVPGGRRRMTIGMPMAVPLEIRRVEHGRAPEVPAPDAAGDLDLERVTQCARSKEEPLELVPPERRRAADMSADDEHGRGKVVTGECGPGDLEVIDVSIVERDRDRAPQAETDQSRLAPVSASARRSPFEASTSRCSAKWAGLTVRPDGSPSSEAIRW